MSDFPADFPKDKLERFLKQHLGSDASLSGLQRLTGGASAETWALDVKTQAQTHKLVLRRTRPGKSLEKRIDMQCEAEIQKAVAVKGVLVPEIIGVLTPEDDLGEGYVMRYLQGETLGHRIARNDEFQGLHARLTNQCAEQLALLHSLPVEIFPQSIPRQSFVTEVASYRDLHLEMGEHLPVFDYAFRWLEERIPPETAPVPVHGDFRNGNLIVHPQQALVAILDWELFHFGHPQEDLGWLCTGSWRFGNWENEVGGFGKIQDFLDRYNGNLSKEITFDGLTFWMVWGSLRWGIICQQQARVHLNGTHQSIEHAAIGRRVSETEADLVTLMRLGE